MVALSHSLLDRGRLGLVLLDPDRKIDVCLGALAKGLVIGSDAAEAIPFLTGLDEVLDDIAAGRRSSFSMPRVAFHEGRFSEKTLSLEITPSEQPGRLQILVRDETEQASLEQSVLQKRNELDLANEALSEAKMRAELALREKASFLAKISHDLKTPLQVIMGNAEILKSDLPVEEREAFLQDVIDNSDFLLAMITDLLDASALETNQLKLVEDVVDVGDLLEQVLWTGRRLPNGSKRQFELGIESRGHAILVDPLRLKRLLLNLVSNAVKFTEDGGRIAVKAGLNDNGGFVIDVEDDGCGIEPEMVERSFEPFITGRTEEGSGLGLHIAKGLAELHDADLTLSSELGVGTQARLCLPKARVTSAPA